MGLRSFSSDAAVAADMVRAEVEGFRDKKMLCCAKHFPGIGAAAGDSHEGAITIEATSEELETVDLVPFRAAIEAGVPMIMVGHVSLPNIVGDSTPAPLSSAVVQGMLRDSLGLHGRRRHRLAFHGRHHRLLHPGGSGGRGTQGRLRHPAHA